jgi:outer membrane protein insertion porin family
VLFVDGGNVWAESSLVRWDDFRWGVGLGVRFDTPAGPLRLEYGRKLNRKRGESLGEVFLSFGIPF